VTLPKRDAIAAELRGEIADGTYPPGSRLPTEAQLIDTYGVARGTVRDALQQLEDAGLVERRVGTQGGTFVRRTLALDIYAWRDDQPMSRHSEADLFFRTAREQGHEPSQEFSVSARPMPPRFAELLAVEAGSTAMVRRCVRSVDGLRHSIQDSWYPDWLCERVPELRHPGNIEQGTTRLLADAGYLQVAALGYTIARQPNADEQKILGLSPLQPLLRNVLVGYTKAGPLRISAATFTVGTRLVSAHGDMSVIERHRP
jgi:GntR family transcriptional regulator